MDPIYYASLTGFIILTVLSFVIKEERPRKILINVFLIGATVFVGYNILKGFQARSGGSSIYTQSDKAELLLKFTSGYVAVDSYVPNSQKMADAGKKKLYKEADQILTEAVEKAPKSATILLKKIVLDGERGKNVSKQVNKLASFDNERAKRLAKLLKAVYVKRKVSSSQYKELQTICQKDMPIGWYKEIVTMQLAKSAHKTKELKSLKADFFEHYLWYMGRLLVFGVIAAVCFLIGVIILLAQLFFLPRKPTGDTESQLIKGPDSFTMKVVFGVFVGWLTVEFLVAPPLKMVSANLVGSASTSGIVYVALLTAGLYLFQNLPALILIWFLAVRPNKLNFFESVKLKFKAGNRGPFKLFFHGWMTWFAAIPVVALAVFISTKLGSQGSDNPILAVVMAAAKEANLAGIILFIIALGVLPAICEEILFRGFLYTALRRRMGVFFSIVISAVVFSAIHLDMGGALQLFALGFMFAFVFEKTKSIFPSMIAHCFWNSCTFIMALVAYS